MLVCCMVTMLVLLFIAYHVWCINKCVSKLVEDKEMTGGASPDMFSNNVKFTSVLDDLGRGPSDQQALADS
jgi:hypothetical protein